LSNPGHSDRRDSLRDAGHGGDPPSCQLTTMPPATRPLKLHEKIDREVSRILRRVAHRARRVIADPLLPAKRLMAAGRRYRRGAGPMYGPPAPTVAPNDGPSGRTADPLREGETVRVRSLPEIRRTLDADGCCQGLAYLPVVMDRYSGSVFTVRKRINRFFDERRWKMLTVRNVVILDGVHCEPPGTANDAWADCDRSCFLFWKEAWLERIPHDNEHR
jgi:hypothetical protein